MNERFLELAKQTDEFFKKEGRSFFRYNWNEKFAELIVQECAKVCLAQRDPANLNYKPSERFAEAVKQHFGLPRN